MTKENLPTEGYAFQRNKRGVCKVTNVESYTFMGDVWLNSDEMKGIRASEFFPSEREALAALNTHLVTQVEKTEKSLQTLKKALEKNIKQIQKIEVK